MCYKCCTRYTHYRCYRRIPAGYWFYCVCCFCVVGIWLKFQPYILPTIPGACPRCPLRAVRAFLMGREIVPGFEGMRRRQHVPPVPTARLARFFIFAKKESASDTRRLFFLWTGKLLPASRECVAADTCPRCPLRAWRAFSSGRKLLPASRECVAADTCPRCPLRAWRAHKRQKNFLKGKLCRFH